MRELYSSSLVASKQTVMRKREHTGFVKPMRLMNLPDMVKSVTTYRKEHRRKRVLIVRVCRVVGVKSDGMFIQGI